MRPREFDEDRVLQIAFERFWRHGVRTASLADIARDANVQRGSLYNAYGSKEALFLRAYERYAEVYLAAIRAAVASGPLRKRLERFFDVAIKNFCGGNFVRGCPTTRGLMDLATSADEGLSRDARRAFAGLIETVQSLLEAAFKDARKARTFAGNPKIAAEHVLAVARGLVVLERAFSDEAQLRRIAAHAVDLVTSSSRADH